jgi:hypothetical protein
MILIYQSQSTLHYCADILECFVKLCIVNNGTAKPKKGILLLLSRFCLYLSFLLPLIPKI